MKLTASRRRLSCSASRCSARLAAAVRSCEVVGTGVGDALPALADAFISSKMLVVGSIEGLLKEETFIKQSSIEFNVFLILTVHY